MIKIGNTFIKKGMIEHFEDLSNKENIQKLIKTQYEERLKYEY